MPSDFIYRTVKEVDLDNKTDVLKTIESAMLRGTITSKDIIVLFGKFKRENDELHRRNTGKDASP